MARKPHFGYLAGLETIPFPAVDDYAEFIEYVRERDADYVLYSYVALSTRSNLRALYGGRVPHEGLKPLAHADVGTLYVVDKRRSPPPPSR